MTAVTLDFSVCVACGGVPGELRPWIDALCHAADSPFVLTFTADTLELEQTSGELGRLNVDFVRGSSGFRAARGRARNERLVRACGLARGNTRVIDATGGLGGDAWILAAAGAEVRLIERDPVVVALLADGLRRARASSPEVVARITLECADSVMALPSVMAKASADVVYLDPMYPGRQKAALGDRRLRMLAALAARHAAPADAVSALLASALACGPKRVVLKRPLKVAAPETHRPPSYSLPGRSTRFDVWL